MIEEKIIFKELSDLNRLPEIYSLYHDALVESGLILPKKNRIFNLYPHLNEIDETTIIIAESNSKIVATNSITVDNKKGLNTDLYFKNETDELRKKYKRIGSSWRIVTDKKFRGSIQLIMNLIKYSTSVIEKTDMEACLCTLEKKHEKIYQNLLNMKTIAEKMCGFDQSTNNKMHMVLMIADVVRSENSWKKLP